MLINEKEYNGAKTLSETAIDRQLKKEPIKIKDSYVHNKICKIARNMNSVFSFAPSDAEKGT